MIEIYKNVQCSCTIRKYTSFFLTELNENVN